MLLLNLLIYGWFSSFSEIKGNFLISSDVKFSFHMTLENFSNHYFDTMSAMIIISDAAGSTSYKEVFFVCEYKETDHKNTLSWISTTEHVNRTSWQWILNNSLKLFFYQKINSRPINFTCHPSESALLNSLHQSVTLYHIWLKLTIAQTLFLNIIPR